METMRTVLLALVATLGIGVPTALAEHPSELEEFGPKVPHAVHATWGAGALVSVWSAHTEMHDELLFGGGVFLTRMIASPLEGKLALRVMRAPHETEVAADLLLKLVFDVGESTQFFIAAGPALAYVVPDSGEEELFFGVASDVGAYQWFGETWGATLSADFTAMFASEHTVLEYGASAGPVLRW